MAEGFKLLDTHDQVQIKNSDAAWFLDRAINKSTNGQDLERRFHQMVDIMARILNTDLFLIAIDDVDTKTGKAAQVLEVLRCYLTHPKLIVLLSGDLKLYSYIVRTQKNIELSSNSRDTYTNNKEELVGHLEQQYLTKILPIEQRIKLKKLDEISEHYKVIIQHSNLKGRVDKTSHQELRDLIKYIFQKPFILNLNTYNPILTLC